MLREYPMFCEMLGQQLDGALKDGEMGSIPSDVIALTQLPELVTLAEIKAFAKTRLQLKAVASYEWDCSEWARGPLVALFESFVWRPLTPQD